MKVLSIDVGSSLTKIYYVKDDESGPRALGGFYGVLSTVPILHTELLYRPRTAKFQIGTKACRDEVFHSFKYALLQSDRSPTISLQLQSWADQLHDEYGISEVQGIDFFMQKFIELLWNDCVERLGEPETVALSIPPTMNIWTAQRVSNIARNAGIPSKKTILIHETTAMLYSRPIQTLLYARSKVPFSSLFS